MKTILIFLSLLLAVSGFSAPLTNTITYNWLDFGYQVDSVTNKPVKITPLEYSTIGSFFMVKTPRIYTNTFAGQCVVTNQQEGSYRVELATALGSITTFTSTIPATATGGTNYEATQFVTNFATNSGSTRSYSITVSDLRYPSTAGSNILFFTNAGRVTIAGTVVTGTSPTVASNYLAVTKLDVTNGTAYNLILSATNSANVALTVTNSNGYTNDSARILGTNRNTGIFLKATGRIGIGTNNPNSTLEVFGISTFNGNITNFGGYASTNRLTLSRPANIGMSNQIFTDVCDQNPVYNSLYVTAGNPGFSRFHIGRSGASFYGVDFHLANLENVASINSVYYRVGNNGSFSSVLSDNGSGVANLQSYWQWVIRPGLANNPSTSATVWNGSAADVYGLVVEGQSTTTPALTIAPKTNTTTSPFTIERGRGAGLVTKIYEITTNGVPVSPGVITTVSNKLAITIIALPASPSLWTNNTGLTVSIGWAGSSVSGVSINSSMWPTALTGGMAILQTNEWIGFTNTGIPTFGYKPF